LGKAGNVDRRARKNNGKAGKEAWIKILEKEGMTQKCGCKGGLSRKEIQKKKRKLVYVRVGGWVGVHCRKV
jgi:hypothetical protein